MDEQRFALTLTLESGYALTARFDEEARAPLTTDEAAPVGTGRGPNPARLLGAAIGSCLGASLLYCLRRARVEVAGLTTRVWGTLVRNERGRWRVGAIDVVLMPAGPVADPERFRRCVSVFEDYCIVTESVRQGIPVSVAVQPPGTLGARARSRRAHTTTT